MLRKAHFNENEAPFPREEAEAHWCWLSLETHQHAANLADALVRKRRHDANHATIHQAGIYESRCAALQYHLTKMHGADVDMHDAEAMLNFRGPRTPEQGAKIIDVLQQVERSFIAEIIRPPPAQRSEFWTDFVDGREEALSRALLALRLRFKEAVDRVSEVVVCDAKSPREHRSRTPPR